MASLPSALTARVAGNSAVLLAARTVTLLAGMVSLPVLYGRLGPRAYGTWVLLAGMVAVASLADLGLGSALIREVARARTGGGRRRARAVLGLGVAGGACLGTLGLVGTAVCWPWLARLYRLDGLASQARTAALLLIAGFLLDSLVMPWRAVLEGIQRYASIARVDSASAVIGAVLAVPAVLLDGGLTALAATVVACSGLRALMLVYSARRNAADLMPSLRLVRRSDVRYLASYGSRVQIANAAAAVNSQLDRMVLAGFFGPAAVAGFDLGSRLVGLLRLPTGIVLTALFPAASGAAEEEPHRLDQMYITLTRYLAVFTATCAAALMVSADSLVLLWLGRSMNAASTAIVLLAPGFAVSVTAGAAALVTRAEGRPGCETRSGVLAAVLNVLLTFPLLRVCGPAGAPLATTLCAVMATAYFYAHFHRRSGRPIAPLVHALWPPALVAATAGMLTRTIASSLPTGSNRVGAALSASWRGCLIVLIVSALLRLLGYFDSTDRLRLRSVCAALTPRRIVPALNWRSR